MIKAEFRNENPQEVEISIEGFSYLGEHVEHIVKPINTEVPDIDRDNNIMGSNESTLRQGTDIGRAVKENVVVCLPPDFEFF